MTKTQQEKLVLLENTALDRYLEKTDFDVADWLDENEQVEYCELYNMQFEYKNCRCGTHEKWM